MDPKGPSGPVTNHHHHHHHRISNAPIMSGALQCHRSLRAKLTGGKCCVKKCVSIVFLAIIQNAHPFFSAMSAGFKHLTLPPKK